MPTKLDMGKVKEVLGEKLFESFKKFNEREEFKDGEAAVMQRARELTAENGKYFAEYDKFDKAADAVFEKAIAYARQELGIPEAVRDTKA